MTSVPSRLLRLFIGVSILCHAPVAFAYLTPGEVFGIDGGDSSGSLVIEEESLREEPVAPVHGEESAETREHVGDPFPQGSPIIIRDGRPVVRDVPPAQPLHSGAPSMAATGMSELIAVLALFVAATTTFVWGSGQKAGAIR